MSIFYIEFLTFILFINFIKTDNNYTSQSDNIITDLNIITLEDKKINKNIKINNIENRISNISNISLNVLNINKENITFSEPNKNINITVYDKNKILEIITNPQQNNSRLNENLIEDDDKNVIQEVQNIVIQNTHEDQLAESLFYFLCFVLIIFIILFLYKFYKCYCQNTIKEFGEEGTTIRNPNNDPELQRISTHDDENIMDVTDN